MRTGSGPRVDLHEMLVSNAFCFRDPLCRFAHVEIYGCLEVHPNVIKPLTF